MMNTTVQAECKSELYLYTKCTRNSNNTLWRIQLTNTINNITPDIPITTHLCTTYTVFQNMPYITVVCVTILTFYTSPYQINPAETPIKWINSNNNIVTVRVFRVIWIAHRHLYLFLGALLLEFARGDNEQKRQGAGANMELQGGRSRAGSAILWQD